MFIELIQEMHRNDVGSNRYLVDLATGWEIYDRGDKPAIWCNDNLGKNMNSAESYAEIKRKLTNSGQFVPDQLAQKYPFDDFPTMAHVLDHWISEKVAEDHTTFLGDGLRAGKLDPSALLKFIRSNAVELSQILRI